MITEPLVSVCCLTYNHVKYVGQCLEGFACQKTNFPFEILIHDDASQDDTQNVILEFAAKYDSEVVKPICQKINQFSQGISPLRQILLPRVKGKYIALCEGDDYWTDPLKLQKQVDFLEAHPEYGMCYTQCVSYRQNTGKFDRTPWGGPNESLESLLRMNTVPTLTVMFRADLLRAYVAEIRPHERDWLMGDYPMWLYFAGNSKIKFLNATTGVYRVLSDSASHASAWQQRIRFIDSTWDIQRFYIERYGIPAEFAEFEQGLVLCKLNVYAKSRQFGKFMQVWGRTIASHPGFACRLLPYAYLGFFLSSDLRRKRW
ncbi:glycosyltransferase [Alistipes sp.]|uniref:glycosyltransferase family 2 protein n=1 Tax=Alistipes sp. TaxID=1872444 RepID=UPI001F9742C2|nr:glycosyltransferase [Alistipes sp.]HJC76143.1 glycosyltransferase [Candidatus Alistipes excrementavium]